MQDTDADILALLTPEQAETFLQMKGERRQHKHGSWGGRFAELDCAAVGDGS
jgi:Spy/CpxP family protein refolding chaperone